MTSAIIVAAGKGTRMGPNVDKLFLELAGKPVVAHTWQRFDAAQCIDEIILVVANLSRFSQVVNLDLSNYAGYLPEEVFSNNRF